MKIAPLALCLALALPFVALAQVADPAYAKKVIDWRAKVEKSLRADNGWLTLAGRYVLKPGENTFGTGPGNDVVFPKGVGSAGMGSIFVENGRVTVRMVEDLKMKKDGIEYSVRDMGTSTENRDWVNVGKRVAFHFIEVNGKFIMRLADNQSEVRENFRARVWYDINDRYYVAAKFVPYEPGKKIAIVNVLDETSDEPVAGYVEFELDGRPYRLDALDDDGGLFIIFSDTTAGETTYKPGRFLFVEEKPEPNKKFMFDLNRAYNPPCAFSEFTTCPLPPKQNKLPVRIEAGEKYPPLKS